MKAAVVERPGVLQVMKVADPIVGPYDVLCKMLFGATCTGTDTHILDGSIPFPIPYPTILGHESIGEAVEVGRHVRNFRPGDLITRVGAPASREYAVNWGGFAELGIARDHWAMCRDGLPREQWDAYRVNQHIPTGIGPMEGTMIITWRETLSYLQRMGVGRGQSVLVVGSGGNGLAFAAHAINKGSSPVVLIGSRAREQTARQIGVDAYFPYDDVALAQRIQAYPQRFDYIIDAVGKEGALAGVMPLLKAGGTVGIYGLDEPTKNSINPRNAPGTFRYYNDNYDEEETHQQVLTYMRRGQLKAELWLDFANVFSLDAIGDAFQAVSAREMTKALIRLH